jgi:rhodanese-related sulfurtransferase
MAKLSKRIAARVGTADKDAPAKGSDHIAVDELVTLLAQPAELAILDVRELGVHVEAGHILLSAPLPLSLLEIRIASLVPRLSTRIVVYDGGSENLAERAVERLRAVGYSDVSALKGGVAAWRAAGLETYTGIHVLSKAFGEFVEHNYGTPRISARDLKAKIDAGEDLIVLDGRTVAEFEDFSIPGAYACPNAELPYRAPGLIPSPDTLVVVNCAGRTRSIIGAQALLNAGIPNKVVSLENGTMAWLFEGFELDSGRANLAPTPTAGALVKAREVAERLRRRFGVQTIDRAGLAALERDGASRTLYRLDVRTREEFEAGHLPGSLWAEGGQLVQATDQWIAIRNARIVLIDDDVGARAAITASWLIQIGWPEVYVHAIDPADEALESGPLPPVAVGLPEPQPTISANELKDLVDTGKVVLLDFSNSATYLAGHLPGARFAIRARLAEGLTRLPSEGPVVVTAEDPALALLAAADVRALTSRPVKLFVGGTAAWLAAGFQAEIRPINLHDAPEDSWASPYRSEDRFAAFRRYLDWEIGLIDQLARDKTVSFKPFDLARLRQAIP